jgi:curved DNA-binding protein CbpA
MKDFYYILGIDENCTSVEIKEAYRKLSKKFHPDLNLNDKYFEKHFREIKEACEILSNPSKRAEYDKKLNKFKLDPSYQNYAEELKRREDELRKREEKIRFRQAFPHYYNSRKFKGTDQRNRTRKVDIGFTLVLIIITFIFGNYVMNVITDAKIDKLKNTTTLAATNPFIPIITHKKKHKAKDRPDIHNFKSKITVKKPDSLETKQDVQKTSVEYPKNAISENSDVKPVAVSYNIPERNNVVLYATNVISNATGVTNMREFDRYSSQVIKEIPRNSKVFVLHKGDVFYKILCDNETGYVPKWALEDK